MNKATGMKTIYQNIIFLFIGLIFGLKYSEFFQYLTLSPDKPLLSDNILNINSSAISISLYNETRILCWILTGPEKHKTHAIHVKNTWGKRCNKLLFISTAADEQLGNVVQFDVPEGHDNLWLKTREAFKYVYDNHFDDADWFLKADDDTYIVMENLREFLYPMSTDAPVYFGYKFQKKELTHKSYMAGGAYVLSKEALYRFATKAYDNKATCEYIHRAEDLQMGMCLDNIGVVAGDSRDMLESNRFLPLPYTIFFKDIVPGWYWDYQFYPQNSTRCCSDSAIAFHYFSGAEMYSMEYLLYYLRPFGIVKSFNLPNKLDMDALMRKWRYEKPFNMTNRNFTNVYKIQT